MKWSQLLGKLVSVAAEKRTESEASQERGKDRIERMREQ